MDLPEPTEGPAKAIQETFRRQLTPVGSLTPASQQGATRLEERRGEDRKQKAVRQRDQPEQFVARFPVAQPKRFDDQFGFLKAETLFDFPAAHRGEGDVPGLLGCLDGLIGEQIPRFASLALPHDD